MSERNHSLEHEVGTEWVTFGDNVGLKTADLQLYERVSSPRVAVLRGACIGNSHFKSLLAANSLTVDHKHGLDDELILPSDLEAINRQVLPSFPKKRPIIVRSSALDERGGSGIYTSVIIVTTGDPEEDLKRLGSAENNVYSDFFAERAVHYRTLESNNAEMGMSLLIQPVVGDEHDGHFMPALSGVLTTVNGQPLLRLVIGLGTRAVEMDEAIVLKGKQVNSDQVIKALSKLRRADTINLSTGDLDTVPVDERMIESATAQLGKLEVLLEEWQKGYDSGSPYYLEFAITESEEKPVILQAAPDEIKPSIPELGMPKGIIICEGADVVNTGERNGRGIVWFGKDGQNPDDLDQIAEFNRNNTNYLLLVRDTAFSQIYGRPLIEMQHFSNAAGVVEVQFQRDEIRIPGGSNFSVDHTKSRGGAHFAEICKRRDILFLGYTVPKIGSDIEQLLGRCTDKLGSFSAYWDVEFSMSNAVSGGRVELMGEVERPEYSLGELRSWANELWYLARELDALETGLSDAFYGVSFLLRTLSSGEVAGFNPFAVSKLFTDENARESGIKEIQKVIENIDRTESGYEFEMQSDWCRDADDRVLEFRLKMYLEKLLIVLLSQ